MLGPLSGVGSLDQCFQHIEYRLFSHYDIRERVLDWVSFASVDPSRHPGCSVWTIAEPLLRIMIEGEDKAAITQMADELAAMITQKAAA